MADPVSTALVITAAGTALSGGILAIARLVDAVTNFLDSRRGGRRGPDLRRARELEEEAQKLRERYHENGGDSSGLSFEAWVTS